MIQTRMTGSALTDKVVFTAAGFPVSNVGRIWISRYRYKGVEGLHRRFLSLVH